MWLLLLLVAVGAGWQVVRLLPLKWGRVEAAAASVAVGFVVAPWAYFAAAAALGWNLGMWVATLALVAGQAAAQLLVKRRASFEPLRRPSWAQLAAWLAAGAVTVLLSYLMFLSYRFPAAGDWYSNGNVWADGPLHVGLITHFAHGNHLDLISPVYKQSVLTYPFISDLWSGVLMRTTSSWAAGLLVPSLLMLWALLVLLYAAGRRLLRSQLGAWLAWYMIVFSGSVQGLLKLWSAALSGTYSSFYQAAQNSLTTATGDTYLNFFNSHIFPQRSYSWGMPVFIVVALIALELWRERRAAGRRAELRAAGIVAGGLLGLMPLVHTHSFMVLAGVLTLATLGMLWRERRLPAGWTGMLVAGGALALPQLFFQFSQGYHSGFSHWIFGWVIEGYGASHRNWLVFWLANTGWLTVTLLGGSYFLRRAAAKAEVWLVYISGVLIFAACNVYVFQPSAWDNMKFFEYAFWFMMLASAAFFVYLSRWRWGRVLTAALMVSLCGLGVYGLAILAPKQNFELLSAGEVQFGRHMASALPAGAYLLVGDRHNHPITMLADRRVLMTYAGWYNLYGADWATTWADRGTMLKGGDGAQDLIRKYGVNFAAVSDAEAASGDADLGFFQSHYAIFDHEAGWYVFDLRRAP
jgi:hypothetical protein